MKSMQLTEKEKMIIRYYASKYADILWTKYESTGNEKVQKEYHELMSALNKANGMKL